MHIEEIRKKKPVLFALFMINSCFAGILLLGALWPLIFMVMGNAFSSGSEKIKREFLQTKIELFGGEAPDILIHSSIIALLIGFILLTISSFALVKGKTALGRTVGNIYAVLMLLCAAAGIFLIDGTASKFIFWPVIHPAIYLFLLNSSFRKRLVV